MMTAFGYAVIKSSWKKNTATFEWNISIPANTSATVYIPAKSLNDVLESGNNLANAEGVTDVKFDNGKVVLQVASGDYQFKSQMK